MRLASLEISGFRGFRDYARIDFGRDFTILTGRNGVGKSTVCDAVEFALTGTISKYLIERSAREKLSDYIWWRGEGQPQSHFVAVTFVGENSAPVVVRRSREQGADLTVDEIGRILCSGPMAEDALSQLCRTSIIRDEWIVSLSVDMSDPERFELVRASLGQSESNRRTLFAKKILGAAESAFQRADKLYESTRSDLTLALSQLAQVRESLAKFGDIDAALVSVKKHAPTEIAAVSELTSWTRSKLAELRLRAPALERLAADCQILEERRWRRDSPDNQIVRRKIFEQFEAAKASLASAETMLREQQRLFEAEEKAEPLAKTLLALAEHGERVGLNDGHCPLCDASRSTGVFREGIAAARRRAESLVAGINKARQRLDQVEKSVENARANYRSVELHSIEINAEDIALTNLEATVSAARNDLSLDEQSSFDPQGIRSKADEEREQIVELERALQALEASNASSRIASEEARIEEMRAASERASTLQSRCRIARDRARELDHAVSRVANEIVDERLALISPLLNELYQRLRPHSDWRSIDYSIRGDIKRFLSLRVGDGLNPHFVFSSGQRRAAGLAFLLAVHLSRSWVRWNTLMLDDPVQHIDDFRALHLVEVMAALRHARRQIFCAVEDPSLADLMCRRLSGGSDTQGIMYSIEISDGVPSLRRIEVPPLAEHVLAHRSAPMSKQA